jgi:hypothetical protein
VAQVRPADDGSPLGRYQPDGDGGGTVHVVLRNLPVRVALASREHHDDLMREFRLLALSGDIDADHAPAYGMYDMDWIFTTSPDDGAATSSPLPM